MNEITGDSQNRPEHESPGRGNESGGRTETPSAGLTEVGQIAITVEDVGRATAFYRDVLGVPFLFDAPGLAFFDLRGTRLLLSRPNGVESASSILYFRAADMQNTYETLLGHGVEFSQTPHVVHRTDAYELSMAVFNDNEGNVMALMHETGTI